MNIGSRIEGNRLIITADNTARRELAESYRRGGYQAAECDLAEYGGFNGANGGLAFMPPETIPDAMTDMPLLADWSINDDGSASVWGTVYGFPDYCITDPWQRLRDRGRVEFVAVADYGKHGARMPERGGVEAIAINAEAYDKLLTNWSPAYPPASD